MVSWTIETVRGPFLPAYYYKSALARRRKWYHLFVAPIVRGQATLAGVYVSTELTSHVQSMGKACPER